MRPEVDLRPFFTQQGSYNPEFLLDMFLPPMSPMLGDFFVSELRDISLLLETTETLHGLDAIHLQLIT